MELSTTRQFCPKYVCASSMPEPYWFFKTRSRAESQRSGVRASGCNGGAAAGLAAGFAAAGAVGCAASVAALGARGSAFVPVGWATAAALSTDGLAAVSAAEDAVTGGAAASGE